MKPCCEARRPAWLRGPARFISWIVPGAVLVLMPKCPACVAAYVALGTGVGLSLTVAEYLRVGALVLSGGLLGLLALRLLVRSRTARLQPRRAGVFNRSGPRNTLNARITMS